MTKIIISIVLSGLSVFSVFYYVKPTYNEAKSTIRSADKYDQALSKAKEIQILRQTLLSQYNLFSDINRAKLNKLLPDDVDNVRLVLDIDGIAAARGIRIGSVKVQAAKDKSSDTNVQTGNAIGFTSAELASNKYETLMLQFTATAPYEQFKLFLRDLEYSLRVVDLTELSISQVGSQSSSTGKTTGPSLYKFDVGVKTYWLK